MTNFIEPDDSRKTGHLVLAHYFPVEGNEQRVLDLLVDLKDASLTESGNLGYEFYAPGGNEGEILIVERYETAEAFAVHRESEHFQSIGKEQIIPLLDERQVEEFTL
ncbi:putative quinol monooxygenase [Brevibacterium sp. CFH 10365]|uniref:putative quinol monooxygenase n=1 Tax=Brevibacterium sp. CFH 10365 TaxID=2585207 RepID=UPI0012667136|nr:antibiotic biosynthesis monooxygenase family protein [Brevibacterium sp. CFH 10365]